MVCDEKSVVMIIDDMPAIIEHARQILKECYKLVPCTSGKQALEIINKVNPDIVLVDINMPDMDGYAVMEKIRQNPKFTDIPVIMITSELTNETETKGFELGVDDFITKPFSPAAMIRRISTQIRLHESGKTE